jgi:septum formation protein
VLVLASGSPRRAELLAAAGIEFTVRVSQIDETPRVGEQPLAYALRMAGEKASAVKVNDGEFVLAADTIVVVDSEIMGKPRDAADAVRMLRALSGRGHEVITAVCLRGDGQTVLDSASTSVWFAELSDEEVRWYVESGEPMDKAGAYGIQGLASRFVERIDGPYSNVVGLPVALVYRLLCQTVTVRGLSGGNCGIRLSSAARHGPERR